MPEPTEPLHITKGDVDDLDNDLDMLDSVMLTLGRGDIVFVKNHRPSVYLTTITRSADRGGDPTVYVTATEDGAYKTLLNYITDIVHDEDDPSFTFTDDVRADVLAWFELQMGMESFDVVRRPLRKTSPETP